MGHVQFYGINVISVFRLCERQVHRIVHSMQSCQQLQRVYVLQVSTPGYVIFSVL